jgi:hypothetical protein
MDQPPESSKSPVLELHKDGAPADPTSSLQVGLREWYHSVARHRPDETQNLGHSTFLHGK